MHTNISQSTSVQALLVIAFCLELSKAFICSCVGNNLRLRGADLVGSPLG
jgi:hypothetical protein